MPNTPIFDHPLIDSEVVYLPFHQPTTGPLHPTVILAAGMRVIIRAVFHHWNDVPGLTMFYVLVLETGQHTHLSERELGVYELDGVWSGVGVP